MTWYPSVVFTPAGGPVTAGSVGNGWTDINSRWSITADNRLASATSSGGSPWNSATLSRLATGERLVDQRVQARFTAGPDCDLWFIMRQTGSGAGISGILAGYGHGGKSQVFELSSGSLSANQVSTFSGLSSGSDYDLQVDCVQTNGTTTVVTISCFAAASSGSALCSGGLVGTAQSYTITSPSIQNVSGGQGMFFFADTPGTYYVKQFATYNDTGAAATALTISPSPASQVVGTAASYSVAANGGLVASTTVALSDGGAGGTFSPSSVTLSSGATSATFGYTPAAAATVTLTAAASGLAAGTVSVTVTAAGTFLTSASSSVVLSPYNWTTGLAGGAARTWNTGAYARAYVTGTSSVQIVTGASNGSATLAYQVDRGPLTVVAAPSNGTVALTLPDAGAHVVTVWLNSLPQTSGRWAGTNAVTLSGFQLGAGGTGSVAVRGARNVLLYGDSITEGIQANDGGDAVIYGYAWLLCQGLADRGWEYGIVACGSSGYSTPVAAGNGGTPAAFLAGNDAASWWNKIDGTGAKRTTGTGASERYVPQPDLIVENWGTNDGLQAIASATVQTAVAGLHAAMRGAAPGAVVVKVVPFGGHVRGAIGAGLAGLGADGRRVLADLAIEGRMASYSNDGVHPKRDGHARIAGLVLGQMLTAWPGQGYAGGFHG